MIKFEILGMGIIVLNTDDPNEYIKPDLSGLRDNARNGLTPDYGAFGHIIDLKEETTAVDVLIYFRNLGFDPEVTSKNLIVNKAFPSGAVS